MAKTKEKYQNVVEMGGNMSNLFEEISSSLDEMQELEKQRKAINDKIAEIRSRLEAKGLVKKGQAAVYSYVKLSPEERLAFDRTYVLMREGAGFPLKGAQIDLFDEKKEKMNAAA